MEIQNSFISQQHRATTRLSEGMLFRVLFRLRARALNCVLCPWSVWEGLWREYIGIMSCGITVIIIVFYKNNFSAPLKNKHLENNY